MMKPFVRLVLIGTAMLTLVACSTWNGEEQPESVSTVYPFVRLSPSPPPPPQIEERPIISEPMKVIWRAGYWSYDGQTFSWISGDYLMKPDPTAWWSPDRWERRTFGWAFIPGNWR